MFGVHHTRPFPLGNRPLGPSLVFIALAAIATVGVGLAVLVTGWDDMSNPVAIFMLAGVGMVAAMAAVALSASGCHGWAAAAALVAAVTPTGFAYLPNLAMLVAAANELRHALRRRPLSTGLEWSRPLWQRRRSTPEVGNREP